MSTRQTSYSIAVLPGDGIGVEVTSQAVRVLEAVAGDDVTFDIEERLVGGVSVDAHGLPLTDEALEVCRRSDAVLLGAVGGPRWDDLPLQQRPESALLALRKALGCYANLRPIWLPPSLAEWTPLKPELVRDGVDIMIVRELMNGLYYGERGRRDRDGDVEAFDTAVYTRGAVSRVARVAFDLARTRRRSLVSLDKSNILETSRLWREVVIEVAADYGDVELRHQLIDSAAMLLMLKPTTFDVVLTNNEFGDIISDEASVLAASLGMIPSASLGEDGPGLFEPIHGSAPDIAGQGIANPLGAILTTAMLLESGLGLHEHGARVRRAVEGALHDGCRTKDLDRDGSGFLSTEEMGAEVVARL